jgi:ubiquinone biosynthesis protein COQ9
MQAESQLAKNAILEVALQLAERRSWDALHLYELASEMGVTLAEIQRHYPDKDALTEAWFDVADAAMLRLPQDAAWQHLPLGERLQSAYWTWLQALAPHRRLTREMLAYKLQPEHLHLQAYGVMRISRTVQCIREVAMVPATGWRRELAEAVLTSTYLAVFSSWLFDDSPGAQRTQALLRRMLGAAGLGARALAYPG